MKRTGLFFLITASYLLSSFAPGPYNFYAINRVVIDAGHGGKDPGCHGKKMLEKNVALAVSMKLGKYIEQNMPDVEVVYTRRDDNFVELYERAKIANRNKSDLFICIHCNSATASAHGSETYVMGLHKTEANLAVAKRENASILLEDDYEKNYDGFDPNSSEAQIIFELHQNVFLDQSLNMAAKVQGKFENLGRFNRGVKQAGFLVLYKTTMPSILIETGFLTNKEEEIFLSKESNQDKMAKAVFDAFKGYKSSMDKLSGVEVESKSGEEEKKEETKTTGEKDPVKVKMEVEKPKTTDEIDLKKNDETVSTEVKKPTEDTPKEKSTENKESKIVYRVQLKTSTKKISVNDPSFKNVEDVWYYENRGMHSYTAGKFYNLQSAGEYQKKLRELGYSDAFVVKFKNGKRVH